MISVIIPVANDCQDLERYLPALVDSFEQLGITDVIVVNDASTDQSSFYLRTNYPDIRVVNSPVKRSLGLAINLAFYYVRYPITWLLSPRTIIEECNLDDAIRYFERPDMFAVVPTINGDLAYERSVNSAEKWWQFHWTAPSIDESVEGRPCLFNGCDSVLVSSEKFRFIGGFDELFEPVDGHHIDLAYSACRRGWRCVFTQTITLTVTDPQHVLTRFQEHYLQQLELMNDYLFRWKHLDQKREWMKMVALILVRMCTFQIRHFRAIMKALLRVSYLVYTRYKGRPVVGRYELMDDLDRAWRQSAT